MDVGERAGAESPADRSAANFHSFVHPRPGHRHCFANTRAVLWNRIAGRIERTGR